MRSKVNFFGIIALVAVIGFAMLSCNDSSDCSHSWEMVVTTEATADADGLKTETCSKCGAKSGKTEVIPQLNADCGDCGVCEDCDPVTDCGDCGVCEDCDPVTGCGDCGVCEDCDPVTGCGDCGVCEDCNPDCEHDFDWQETRTGIEIETCQNAACEETRGDIRLTLALGDTGPAGGKIFHIVPAGFTVQGYGNPGDEGYFETYTAYYLEAAPANMATTLMWASNSNDLIPGLSNWNDQTDWAIGRGRLNTAIIIARGVSQSYTTPAASACVALTTGDKNDWFLPSRYELNQLYIRRADFGLSSDWFWSSSQENASFVRIQFFDDGHYSNYGKSTNDGNVRAVRAF